MNKILKLQENTKGRDFFVGDLHGCYDLLLYNMGLPHINFDFSKDRLICVGDLADRGPSSEECVKMLDESWFFAVKGNHEDMCIGVHRGNWPRDNFIANGGQWFLNIGGFPERQEAVVQLMEQLPLLIEVPFKGKKIGVLHADAMADSWEDYNKNSNIFNEEVLLWGRSRIKHSIPIPVEDIDVIVVGHTPVKQPTLIANVLYIDTGAVYGKGLTILEASEVLKFIE